MGEASIRIEIAWTAGAGAGVQLATMQVASDATVAQALRVFSADPRAAGLDLEHCPVGIFGRVVSRTQGLGEGDRLEIYRPLPVDPKAARRQRAKAAPRRR